MRKLKNIISFLFSYRLSTGIAVFFLMWPLTVGSFIYMSNNLIEENKYEITLADLDYSQHKYSYHVGNTKFEFHKNLSGSRDSIFKTGSNKVTKVPILYNPASPKEHIDQLYHEQTKMVWYLLFIFFLFLSWNTIKLFYFPSLTTLFIVNIIALFTLIIPFHIIGRLIYFSHKYGLNIITLMTDGWAILLFLYMAMAGIILNLNLIKKLLHRGLLVRKEIVSASFFDSDTIYLRFKDLSKEKNSSFPKNNYLRLLSFSLYYKKSRIITIVYDPKNHKNFRILACSKVKE